MGLPVGLPAGLPVGSPVGVPVGLPVGVGLGVGAGGAACAVCLGAAPVRVTRAGFGLWPVKSLDMNLIWRRTRGVPRFEAFAAVPC